MKFFLVCFLFCSAYAAKEHEEHVNIISHEYYDGSWSVENYNPQKNSQKIFYFAPVGYIQMSKSGVVSTKLLDIRELYFLQDEEEDNT